MTPEIKTRVAQIRRGEVPEGYKRVARRISPQEWEKLKLGDVYTERKEPGEEGLPILTVSIHSGVSDGELDEEEIGKKVKRIEDKSQYRKAMSGDLVFNMMRAWQGAIGVVKTTGMVSPAYIVAKPSEKLFPPFMDDYMRTPTMIQKIHSQSYGVTDFRLRLYWDSFAPIDCCLPSIEEQQKIASILTTQDKVIELKEKLLGEKQRQKKALMQQLLTGEKRIKGFTDSWKRTTLRDCTTMNSGGTPDSSHQEYYGVDYPWVSIKDMSSTGKYILKTERALSLEGLQNSSARLFPENTVLFAMYASVGECCIAQMQCCTSQAILGMCPRKTLNNEFLYYTLLNNKEKYKQLSQASSQPNLNKGIVESIVIVLPSIQEQDAIVSILSTADREIDLLQKEIEQEKQKKKALMQMLLTGIVRV